jgi:hypothetical protein
VYSREFCFNDQDIAKFVNNNIGLFKKFNIDKAGDIFDSNFEDLYQKMKPDLPDTIKPLIEKFYDQMKEINKRMFELYLPDQQLLVKKALEESR